MRLAVVLSPATYNQKVGLALCCPVTNRVKGYPFEVALPEGLDMAGVVLSDQVRCLDWRVRDAAIITRLDEETIGSILVKLRALL